MMKELAEKSNISGKYIKNGFLRKLFGFCRRHPIWQLIISSFLLNFAVEALGRHSLIGAAEFVFRAPVQFFLGTLIIWFVACNFIFFLRAEELCIFLLCLYGLD